MTRLSSNVTVIGSNVIVTDLQLNLQITSNTHTLTSKESKLLSNTGCLCFIASPTA